MTSSGAAWTRRWAARTSRAYGKAEQNRSALSSWIAEPAQLLATIAIGLALEYGLQLIVGTTPRTVPNTWSDSTVHILGGVVTVQRLVVVLVAAALIVSELWQTPVIRRRPGTSRASSS